MKKFITEAKEIDLDGSDNVGGTPSTDPTQLSSIVTLEPDDRIKYPRTFHLPWSLGQSDDDKTHDLETVELMFGGKEVVVTEKMDGENTTIYSDGKCHARSTNSNNHPSRAYVKAKAAELGCNLPKGWRLMGENLYAQHSIEYTDLPDYFMLFGIANEYNDSLAWDEVETWAQLLEIPSAPVLWRGVWDAKAIQKLFPFNSFIGGKQAEGYVVRIADSFPMKDFRKNVAKFVRANHVQTDQHWTEKPIVPNVMKARE